MYLRWVRNTDQHIFWSRCHMLGTSVLDEGIWTIHSWRYSIKPNKKNNHKHLLIIIVRRPFPYLRIVEDSKCCAKEWLIANRILTRCDQLYQRVGDFILLMSTRSCLQVLKGFWIFVNLTFIHYWVTKPVWNFLWVYESVLKRVSAPKKFARVWVWSEHSSRKQNRMCLDRCLKQEWTYQMAVRAPPSGGWKKQI